METVAIVINSIHQDFTYSRNTAEWKIITGAKKVVLIFIETQNWFLTNDPQTICASLNAVSSKAGTERRNVIGLLKSLEFGVKINNKKAEVVKIILIGSEKDKIKKCLGELNLNLVIVFVHKKRSFFDKIFNNPLGTVLSEELNVPVLSVRNLAK